MVDFFWFMAIMTGAMIVLFGILAGSLYLYEIWQSLK